YSSGAAALSPDRALPGVTGESKWILCLSQPAAVRLGCRHTRAGASFASRVSADLWATAPAPGLTRRRRICWAVAHPHADATGRGEREGGASLEAAHHR